MRLYKTHRLSRDSSFRAVITAGRSLADAAGCDDAKRLKDLRLRTIATQRFQLWIGNGALVAGVEPLGNPLELGDMCCRGQQNLVTKS